MRRQARLGVREASGAIGRARPCATEGEAEEVGPRTRGKGAHGPPKHHPEKGSVDTVFELCTIEDNFV